MRSIVAESKIRKHKVDLKHWKEVMELFSSKLLLVSKNSAFANKITVSALFNAYRYFALPREETEIASRRSMLTRVKCGTCWFLADTTVLRGIKLTTNKNKKAVSVCFVRCSYCGFTSRAEFPQRQIVHFCYTKMSIILKAQ